MLGVTTDTLLNDNGYEQHVVDIKDKEFLQNMKRVDSMSEEDRAFVKKMLELMDSGSPSEICSQGKIARKIS